ncbi:MAG: exosortase-associated EpsI family protein [Kiritimatiellaeota bacterium]|nr:exosortase-associated EpsI family protein [Kiritimatiellota bacterium]
MNKKLLDWARWGLLFLLVVCGWLHYKSMFSYIMLFVVSPLEDMTHAWFVPPISLFILYKHRDKFRQAAGLPSWRGFGWVCLFLAIAWFGDRGGQARIAQVSAIGLIWSIPYAFWGRGIGRLMLFPAWFLIFTVPISSYLDFFTVHLRIFSTNMAVFILNGLGMDIQNSGTAIFSIVRGQGGSFGMEGAGFSLTPAQGVRFSVDVADACSGIRSLFAIMTLMAAYPYLFVKSVVHRWIMFACAIPVAMIGNMFRIFSICIIARFLGQEVATGFYHSFSPFVIFFVAVLLMFGLQMLIVRFESRLRKKGSLPQWWRKRSEASAPAADLSNARHTLVILSLTCGLIFLTFQSSRFIGKPEFDEVPFIADDLPHLIDGYTSTRPWFCHDDQCNTSVEENVLISRDLRDGDGFKCPACDKPMHKVSLGEMRDLPADTTILKRTYRSAGGESYAVSVVISGRNRSSIHRPELCLPAQGFVMLGTATRPLRIVGGHPREARVISAQRSASTQQFSHVYWFVSREHETTSHAGRILTDMWDRSIRNRINRWAMVAIYASTPLDTPESMEAFETFLGILYPQIFRADH